MGSVIAVAPTSALGFKDREHGVQEIMMTMMMVVSLPGRLLVSWIAILTTPLFHVENKREVH
ncbi:MAG TPA: hypothetical protein VHA09_09560 [Nitrososphaera sp.]|nr:hypothetical protein [Nitrososphaera sp.]